LSFKDELPSVCDCGGKLNKTLEGINGSFRFKLLGECWSSDGYKYTYTDCKAASNENARCVHGRKGIDKKLKAIRMED